MNILLSTFCIVALILAALALRSRSRGGAISCPSCDGPARLHEPYVMCDSCQRCIGLRINNKNSLLAIDIWSGPGLGRLNK